MRCGEDFLEIPASGRLFRDSRQEEGCVLAENRINAEVLIGEARKVRQKAYAPYSGFLVGAALLGADGKIYTGCNVENASFGAGICAERSAFVRAVSEGEKEFLAIAIVGGKKEEQTSLP
ncbi:MAG: cytidine deaminase, partial [Lachnospiraceae bacterium]|nr:cytidine deaminase [Lachnospiraceae bacterium]